MKILFIARHFTYFRNFDSAVAELARRGHQVHLAADRDDAQGGRQLVDRLAAAHGGISVGTTPIRVRGRYSRVSTALRLGLDYLRYSDPRYAAVPKIRERAYSRTPAFVLLLARLPARRFLMWLLERLEEAVPQHAGVRAFVEAERPDLVLVTPLIELGSPQLDYVRAARQLGVRTALSVWSWDHLSSKALIRVVPDAVLVWNEVQKEEAARFHGITGDRVVVTGAQCFDRWFGRSPSRTREEFCRAAGLPNAGPFVLYVCSALFRGSPSEAAFVREWVAALRASADPRVRALNILVRPHPQRLEEWATAPALAGAVVAGSNPVEPQGRDAYFDALFHSAAVVGLNTSAMIEAAIVDRPVLTILAPQFRDNQEGTFHFRYLSAANGFLTCARSMEEHAGQLGEALQRGGEPRNRAFVERFIRPHGLATPATMRFADAVEQLAQTPPPKAAPAPRWVPLLRPVVYALVIAARLPLLQRLYWNPAKFRQIANA